MQLIKKEVQFVDQVHLFFTLLADKKFIGFDNVGFENTELARNTLVIDLLCVTKKHIAHNGLHILGSTKPPRHQ